MDYPHFRLQRYTWITAPAISFVLILVGFAFLLTRVDGLQYVGGAIILAALAIPITIGRIGRLADKATDAPESAGASAQEQAPASQRLASDVEQHDEGSYVVEDSEPFQTVSQHPTDAGEDSPAPFELGTRIMRLARSISPLDERSSTARFLIGEVDELLATSDVLSLTPEGLRILKWSLSHLESSFLRESRSSTAIQTLLVEIRRCQGNIAEAAMLSRTLSQEAGSSTKDTEETPTPWQSTV